MQTALSKQQGVLTGVGAELKQARQAKRLAIAEVAQQLKLLPRQIESLEHERFDRLPGPAIARGMVRNYARLLNLDPEPLVKRMAPHVDHLPGSAPIAERSGQQVRPSSVKRRSRLLFVVFTAVLLVVVGAIVYEWQREKAAPEFVLPVEPQRPEPAPPVADPAETAIPVEEPPATEKPQVTLEAEAPAKPAPAAAAKPAPPPVSRRLVLRTNEEAWLEVRDGTGRSLVSWLSPAGSERAVRGQPPFQLVIGNAAHVELTYDGKPVDLKPYLRGEVARFTLN
jgi:cytoskeleton protein RodZ